tara:strand:+ start:2254 stop:2532 length:279 start_codon:yes stop_codon:yes gene_type:complete
MNQFVKFNPATTGNFSNVILNVDMIAGPVYPNFPAIYIPLKTGKNAFMELEYVDTATAESAKKALDAALYNSNPGVGTFEIIGQLSNVEYSS